MSQLLYDGYLQIIQNPDALETSGKAKLQTKRQSGFDEVHRQLYALIHKNKLLNSKAAGEINNNLQKISFLRQTFLELWQQDFAVRYKAPLYEQHIKLTNKHLFECYNYWLLGKCDQIAFSQWMSYNSPAYQTFITWFIGNPMNITFDEYMMRHEYVEKNTEGG